MFDKWFGKKKEEIRDSSSVTIKNLRIGDFVDYFLKSWQVKDIYEYDWGNNCFTHEYKLDSGDDIIYLHVEEDDELKLNIARKKSVMQINRLLRNHIIEYDEPMKSLEFEGKLYSQTLETQGHCKSINDDDDEWEPFVAWEYADEKEENYIYIERWGEQEFEGALGIKVKEFEFSNIIPS